MCAQLAATRLLLSGVNRFIVRFHDSSNIMGPTHTIAFTAGDTDYFMLQPLSILDKDSAAAVATTHKRGVSAAESMAALLGRSY